MTPSSSPPPSPAIRDPEDTVLRTAAFVLVALPIAILVLGLIIGFKPAVVIAVLGFGLAVILARNSIGAALRWHSPQLEVAPGPYHLGSRPTVVYRRRPRRVIDVATGIVECRLICEEHVTYTQGTDTRTDSRVVFEQDCSGSGEGSVDGFIAHLELDLTAQAGGPSLELSNNKIKWYIEVGMKGERLPKDSHRFVISVGAALDHSLRAGLQDT